ncbi:MAG: NADH-quinone oxidoreductase subunit NuoE [Deltaproteobacteria bacterium]|nr:NADH-quinone oxidoreductase subunit NuoE [Deltaproteobacteria bacterium]
MINQPRFDAILARHENHPANLIPVLQEIQDEFNYLPKDELKVVADKLQVPLTQVYSVATFFKMFSLEPKGRHQIRVCLGTACHLRGGQRLVETVSRRLGVEVGHATEDLNFSLETVGCLGSCAQAPLMMVDDKYFGRMAVDKVPKILKLYKKQDQD